jgi:hypothetical protein
MTFRLVIHDGFSTLREAFERRLEKPHMIIRGVINQCLMPDRLTIWAFDGKGGNDRRRAIYPNYKNRPPHPSHIQQGMAMIREMIGHTPAWRVGIDGYEADDLIAALIDLFPNDPITIITRDGDLRALATKRVTVTARVKNEIPAQWVRLYKLCCGDSSDTIPGIKGFGDKAWDAASDKAMLQAWIDHALVGHVDEERAPMPKRCVNWVRDNLADLRAMHTILQPMPIPNDQLADAIQRGVNNPAAIEAMMKDFHL